MPGRASICSVISLIQTTRHCELSSSASWRVATSACHEWSQGWNELGIAITEEDVVAVSGDAMASGRPHIADALVRLGVVRDRDEAFSELLSTGGPAYIPGTAPRWIRRSRWWQPPAG